MNSLEIVFHKGIDLEEIKEDIRELIEDKFGIEILEINRRNK